MRLPRFGNNMHPMFILTLIALVVILIELVGGNLLNFILPLLRQLFGNSQ